MNFNFNKIVIYNITVLNKIDIICYYYSFKILGINNLGNLPTNFKIYRL